METIYIILLVVMGGVFSLALLVWRVRKISFKKENQVFIPNMDGIIPYRDSTGKLQPISPGQQRAEKFRERARITRIGRPEFKLSKKYIEKKSLNQQISYWYLEAKMNESTNSTDAGSTYCESDLESMGTTPCTPSTSTRTSPRGELMPTMYPFTSTCGAIAE